jgi:phenol/toluene 2-monooxygenase (NADH) P4/A4
MAVVALAENYAGEVKDRVENFHGNQLIYIGWEDHLMFCAPLCIPVPLSMPFGALVKDALPRLYSSHPEWERIDWGKVHWLCSGEPFTPVLDKSLADNGIGHKAVIRFRTPGLTGIQGSCS